MAVGHLLLTITVLLGLAVAVAEILAAAGP